MKAERKKEKILIIILFVLIAIIISLYILISNIKNNNKIDNKTNNEPDNRLYGLWWPLKQEIYKDNHLWSTREDYSDNYININKINLSFCSMNDEKTDSCSSYTYSSNTNNKIIVDYEDNKKSFDYSFNSKEQMILKNCSDEICYLTYYEKSKG